jgi:predicted type IV restriction endonuclease
MQGSLRTPCKQPLLTPTFRLKRILEGILDFSQRIQDVANRSRQASLIALTEEATKTSVVLPFLQALGFDVFNLEEVVPEFVADVGIKKGEKIDFALNIGGKPAILVEVKPISMSLGNAQYSQLFRYFSTVEARLAILINGREIWFFSDIDEKNKMDKKPFFVFDLQNYDERQVSELARFQKSSFDIENILEAASNLKYVKAAAAEFSKQLASPDDEFVRFIGRQIYDGTMTKSAVEMLRPAIQAALDEVIRNRIQERLNVTFGKDSHTHEAPEKSVVVEQEETSDIVTTPDEIQAFMIVRAIGSRIAPVGRITMRDAKSWCSIFMDDNNRKPICRLYFNGKNSKSIGIFAPDKTETKYLIDDLSDIFKFSESLENAVKAYA